MSVTTTFKEQNLKKQHFFAWDGVRRRFVSWDRCLCGKTKKAYLKENYPLHFPEIEPPEHRGEQN